MFASVQYRNLKVVHKTVLGHRCIRLYGPYVIAMPALASISDGHFLSTYLDRPMVACVELQQSLMVSASLLHACTLICTGLLAARQRLKSDKPTSQSLHSYRRLSGAARLNFNDMQLTTARR
jgi:hypothetical protein